MILQIDGTVCQGHAQCQIVAPSLFSADEWGHAIALSDNVVAEQLKLARKAVASCPERAIQLIEEHP